MLELKMQHLDDFTLLRYVAKDLDDAERETASAHIAVCTTCQTTLAEIEELDQELTAIANDPNARGDFELEDLPKGDPFRRRPSLERRDRPLATAEDYFPIGAAAAASEEGAALSAVILEAAKSSPKDVESVFSRLSILEVTSRFALLYALQDAGREISQCPARFLSFAENCLAHFRNFTAQGSSPSECERMVPLVAVIGQAHQLAGQACLWTSEYERGESHLRLAYRAFGQVGDELRLATVELDESQRRHFLGRSAQALVLALRARNTLSVLGLEEAVARAKVCEGLALYGLDRPEEAIELYRSAVSVFEEKKLWASYIGAINCIGVSLVRLRRLDEARREYARALRRVSREKHSALVAYIRHDLAEILFSAGRYREAAVSASQAIRLYQQCGLSLNSLKAALFEIEAWARTGDLARAHHRLELFRAEVVKRGVLEQSAAREIEEALSGRNPDFQRLAQIREHATEAITERLGGFSA